MISYRLEMSFCFRYLALLESFLYCAHVVSQLIYLEAQKGSVCQFWAQYVGDACC